MIEYDKAMRHYIESAEIAPSTTRIYEMPHRPVYRDDKDTTKLRCVFDASAHQLGAPSLNDLLLSGEKAFLQIGILEPEEMHSDTYGMIKIPNITNYRMKRVTFGVTSSPFLLAAALLKHLSEPCTDPEEGR